MLILDGRTTSKRIMTDLKLRLENGSAVKPNLDIILVGNDPASHKYVYLKQKYAQRIGIGGRIHELPQDSSVNDVLKLVDKLNQDPSVTAFMIQLPLPPQINKIPVLEAIDPKKDADGLTATNLGLLFQRNNNAIASATPLGIIKLLEEYGQKIDGKNVVVVGRGVITGIPALALFMANNATVTLCHSHTKDLAGICSKADILVSSVGKSKFITPDFVKEGAMVIDIGTSVDPDTGKMVGDVDFETVAPKCSYITPVPGGVGPMTIACLLANTVRIWERNSN